MEIFASLSLNIALLLIAAVCIFLIIAKAELPLDSRRRQAVVGVFFGLAAVAVIEFPVYGPFGSAFDTRAAPLLVSTYYVGPLAGGITAILGAAARLNVGGPAAIGGVASFGFYLVFAFLLRKYWGRYALGLSGLTILASGATLSVLPSFFIGQSIAAGWKILLTFWPILLAGNLIGTIVLGLIVEQFRDFLDTKSELAAIINSGPDGIITVDRDLRILSLNPKAVELFGWSPQEAIGRNINVFVPDQYVQDHDELANGYINDEFATSREMTGFRIVQGQRKNGSHLPILVSLSKYRKAGDTITVATVHDMTEVHSARQDLVKLSSQLAAQLNEAIAINEAKNRFLANISHELRTPLNAIIGFSSFLETAQSGDISNEKSKEYLADIRLSGEALLAMIADVIDISKIEEDRLDVDLQPTTVETVTNDAIKLTLNAANARKISLVPVSLEGQVIADVLSLRQVLTNLITNSIKYSPTGSEIRIYSEIVGDQTTITVEDDGIGIPDAVISRLGEPFLRGESPEVRMTEGAGLGLALSIRFLERQNGELRLERKESGGTRATIVLESVP